MQYIAALKKERLTGVRRANRKRAWAFSEAETTIEKDATQEQVKQILERVGSDKFEQILDDAYDFYRARHQLLSMRVKIVARPRPVR